MKQYILFSSIQVYTRQYAVCQYSIPNSLSDGQNIGQTGQNLWKLWTRFTDLIFCVYFSICKYASYQFGKVTLMLTQFYSNISQFILLHMYISGFYTYTLFGKNCTLFQPCKIAVNIYQGWKIPANIFYKIPLCLRF